MSGFYGVDDDPQTIDAETDLLTAEASAVDGFPAQDETSEPEPYPIGRTWAFDWQRERFRRTGLSPTELRGHDSLGVWIETALRIGRFTYGIFTDDYGLPDPEVPIGEVVTTAQLSNIAKRIETAMLSHDRIQAVENIVIEVEGDAIMIKNMEIVLDETNRLSLMDTKVA